MHQPAHKLVEQFLTRVMALWVKPEVLPVQPATLLDAAKPVLYVLETGGMADRAALNIVTRRCNMPGPSSTLVYGKASESGSVDVLRQRRGIIFRRHRLVRSPRLQRLVNQALHEQAGEIQIVPVAVYWGRAPDKQKSLWSLFFSENWQIGGRTRKLITTLLYGRDTLLSISEPLSMTALLESSTEDDNAERLQRKLSRILRVHFRQRRIASLGPDQSHKRMLVDHVLADPGVKKAIEGLHSESGQPVQKNRANAEKYAYEIAADVSYPTVRVLHRVMNRLWTELYEGVETYGIERLKSVADGRELVYVPCHRSHIDYLLLSYILYINGYSLPHIAAGINLNLPVVGKLLRRGGAFFLRRTFSGNKLYAAVFNAYLKEILQRGHAIEYFVEGGRSRTGKLLPPKAGMLAMTAHAYLHDTRTPVVFVPVYFGYERLLEGRAFTSELAGGKKQKESVFALLKSLRTLREDYGRVYVNFGDPIELDSLLDEHRSDWRELQVEETRPGWLNPVIDGLGERIMQNINRAACITPISLLAMALLATPLGRLSAKDLKQQMRVYLKLLGTATTGSTVVVPDIDVEDVIPHARKLGFIQSTEDQLGSLVSIKPGLAAPLTYFRNNIQHLLTLPALVACCFTNSRVRSKSDVRRLVMYAYPFFRTELFLSESSPDDALDHTLQAMAEGGLVINDNENWQRAPTGTTEAVSLMRLAEVVMPTLERYFLAAARLVMAGSDGIERKQLAEQCRVCAERLALTHGRDAGDLYDKHLYGALIETLLDTGYIQAEGDILLASRKLHGVENEARTLLREQMRHAIVNTLLCLEH